MRRQGPPGPARSAGSSCTRVAAWLAALAAGLVALAPFGCAPPAQVQYEEELEAAPAPARHGVHSERLRQRMHELQRIAVARLPTALDVRREQARGAQSVARVLRAMAESARRINDVVPELELEAREREAFLELAATLARDAETLARRAPELAPETLRARVDAVEKTCSRCHDRFRIPLPEGAR